MRKNQAPFDFNKVVTRLVEGARSGRDGRCSFWYENLLKALNEAGIQIDENVLYTISEKRYEIAGARSRRNNQHPKPKDWFSFAFKASADVHFDLCFGHGAESYPPYTVVDSRFTAEEEELDTYTYSVPDIKSAAELWRWIKKYHPDNTELKITKEEYSTIRKRG